MYIYVLFSQYIHQGTPCNRYDVEESLINSSPDLQAYYKEHEEVFQYVGKYSGYTMTSEDVIESSWHISDVYDTLLVEVRTDVFHIYNLDFFKSFTIQ